MALKTGLPEVHSAFPVGNVIAFQKCLGSHVKCCSSVECQQFTAKTLQKHNYQIIHNGQLEGFTKNRAIKNKTILKNKKLDTCLQISNGSQSLKGLYCFYVGVVSHSHTGVVASSFCPQSQFRLFILVHGQREAGHILACCAVSSGG